MSFALFFNTLIHFCTNFRLIMRWYEDNAFAAVGNARSIHVGMAPDAPMTYDRRTGEAEGLAVPEADREVFKKPIHFRLKEAIQAIPYKDENGEAIDEQDSKFVIAGVVHDSTKIFKSSVYDPGLGDISSSA